MNDQRHAFMSRFNRVMEAFGALNDVELAFNRVVIDEAMSLFEKTMRSLPRTAPPPAYQYQDRYDNPGQRQIGYGPYGAPPYGHGAGGGALGNPDPGLIHNPPPEPPTPAVGGPDLVRVLSELQQSMAAIRNEQEAMRNDRDRMAQALESAGITADVLNSTQFFEAPPGLSKDQARELMESPGGLLG